MPKKDESRAKSNWEKMYELHRLRVKTAKCTVDHNPPMIHAGNYVRLGKMKEDGETLIKHMRANTEIFNMLAGVKMTQGVVNTYHSHTRPFKSTMIATAKRELRLLEAENRKFGEKLLDIKTVLDSQNPLVRKPRQDVEKAKPFVVPTDVLKKYGLSIERFLNLPKDELKNLLRPKIYLDMEMRGFRSMGRIVIELYTETAPQVVSEFIRVCRSRDPSLFTIRRVFPSLWSACELKIFKGAICCKPLEYDMRSIDHQSGRGILSFSMKDRSGFTDGTLTFVMSFKPLRVVNGKRVAFGRITSGLKVLKSIEDYGSKNGKPTRNIGVSRCGIKDPNDRKKK